MMPDHPLLKQWLFDPAVVGVPFIQELGGLHALELVADLIDAKGWWQHGFPPSSFPKYVAHLAAPMERPQPGFVRILYFPTRPGDIPAFLALISFVILFARLNHYHGPVAWLNFPLGLLDEAHIGTLQSVMVELDRLVLSSLLVRAHRRHGNLCLVPFLLRSGDCRSSAFPVGRSAR
jgi:hypothetical protein